MEQLYGPVWGHHFLAWIETDAGLVAVDTGYDVADGEPYEGSDVEAITQAAEALGKPLTHILLTHDHADHVLNLPLLLERWPAAKVYAHPNSTVEGVTHRLHGEERLEPGGLPIRVIASPGHSEAGDELSYHLPDHDFLFCGDVAQPQGPNYSYANGVSPVPYFYDGEAYRRTLERLIRLDPERVRTGHGEYLGPEQVKQWFRVTLATVVRIEELAVQYAERYPDREAAWLAETIFDQIADERHFSFSAANRRKRQRSDGEVTDYERYDLPGILWFVREAKTLF